VTDASTKYLQLLSEWDIDSDSTPAAIAERRHPFNAVQHRVPLVMPSQMKADAKKQMLMYGHVDLPTDNFSYKKDSGAPQCEDGCAFRDKVFTVEVSTEVSSSDAAAAKIVGERQRGAPRQSCRASSG